MSRTALQISEVQQDLNDEIRREIHLSDASGPSSRPTRTPSEPRSGKAYPRPAKGILVAMTVMVATFASRGSSAM
jgi:hypothetical protein